DGGIFGGIFCFIYKKVIIYHAIAFLIYSYYRTI
ncbi:MFS transporter, partial [Salmonella enterica]|nr:MFS transporter [Salmonella enterica]